MTNDRGSKIEDRGWKIVGSRSALLGLSFVPSVLRHPNGMNDLQAIGAWLAREGMALWIRLREPELWAALLIGLLLWSLAYQSAPAQTLYIGGDARTHDRDYDAPFLTVGSFNESEPGGKRDGKEWWEQELPPYRWATDDATVLLPGLGGGRWAVKVWAASGRAGGAVPSHWQVGDGTPVPLSIDARPSVYTIAGDANGGDLRLTMRTPRYDAPGDSRSLGLVIHSISVTAIENPGLRMPAPGQLALLAFCLVVCYSLVRRLSLPRRWALALALGVAALFALLLVEHRLALTIWALALAWLSAICYLLAILLAPLLAVAARAAGLQVRHSECDAALAATIGAFGMRMAGLLHPYAKFSDLDFNVHNFEAVIGGKLFLYAGLPCEAGGGQAPYPPAQYLALAPLRLLFGTEQQTARWLIQGGNALLESCSAALIWLLLRRTGLCRRAALFGAALYIVIPPLLRSFPTGEFANIFGQSLLVPLLLFLLLGAPHAQRWPAALLGALLLLLILLSHTGVTLSVIALLLAWMPLWWFSQHAARARPWPLLIAGAAAVLVAMGLFYSSYTALFQQRQALAAPQPAAAAPGSAAPTGERCPPDHPFGEKLIGNLRSGFSTEKGLSPLLVTTGGLGILWLWKRRPIRLDLALLACWLGTLLSFATLINTDQVVRWQPFLFPALCLGAAPLFASWTRRGRAGVALALVALVYLTWLGVALWADQIVNYLH
jgi:hypothetical protein